MTRIIARRTSPALSEIRPEPRSGAGRPSRRAPPRMTRSVASRRAPRVLFPAFLIRHSRSGERRSRRPGPSREKGGPGGAWRDLPSPPDRTASNLDPVRRIRP
jgi:hypothetical protein